MCGMSVVCVWCVCGTYVVRVWYECGIPVWYWGQLSCC